MSLRTYSTARKSCATRIETNAVDATTQLETRHIAPLFAAALFAHVRLALPTLARAHPPRFLLMIPMAPYPHAPYAPSPCIPYETCHRRVPRRGTTPLRTERATCTSPEATAVHSCECKTLFASSFLIGWSLLISPFSGLGSLYPTE